MRICLLMFLTISMHLKAAYAVFNLSYGGLVREDYPRIMQWRMNLALSDDGYTLYVAGDPYREYSSYLVSCFRAEPGGCTIQHSASLYEFTDNIPSIAGISRIAPSRSGTLAYTISEVLNTLSWFSCDSISGAIKYIGMLQRGMPGAIGLSRARELAVSPQGTLLAVGSKDSLSWYRIDESSEAPRNIGSLAFGIGSGEGYSAQLLFSHDGDYLYGVSPDGRSILWFTYDAADSSLKYSGAILDTLWGDSIYNSAYAIGLALSYDERYLYAGLKNLNGTYTRITWYARDTMTGALARRGSVTSEKEKGVSGLTSIAASPRLPLVFVGLDDYDAVSWFIINPDEGSLACGGIVFGDQVSGEKIYSITCSPTTSCVYAAGMYRIYWFTIDTISAVCKGAISKDVARQRPEADRNILTDIRGRNVLASSRVQGVYLSGATRGRLILRKAFVR